MSSEVWIGVFAFFIVLALMTSFPKTAAKINDACKPTATALDSTAAKLDRYFSGGR